MKCPAFLQGLSEHEFGSQPTWAVGLPRGARKRGSNKLDGALRTSFISVFILQVCIEHYIPARLQMLALSTWSIGYGLQEALVPSRPCAGH